MNPTVFRAGGPTSSPSGAAAGQTGGPRARPRVEAGGRRAPAVHRLSWCALGALMLALLGAGGPVMAIEEPHYDRVGDYGAFELRRYGPLVMAEVEVSGEFSEVGNRAFRILLAYISGENRARRDIPMTAPVAQAPAGEKTATTSPSAAATAQPTTTQPSTGEKIAMTAPVAQSAGSGGRHVLGFVMPAEASLETLPEPLDPRVRLRRVEARLVAVRRYAGGWSERLYREHEGVLLEAVRAAGLRPLGPPVFARYNSPFSLWFLRRNEVMVEVAEPPPAP